MEEASFISEAEEGAKATPPAPPTKEEDAQKPPLSKLEELEKQLDDAITKEDYERAAKIRDEIKKLQTRNS